MQSSATLEIGTQTATTTDNQTHHLAASYFVVESTTPEGDIVHGLQNVISDGDLVRAKLTIRAGVLRFEGAIKYFSIQPKDLDDSQWGISRVIGNSDQVRVLDENSTAAIRRGAHFERNDLDDRLSGQVQVGSSLPNGELQADAVDEQQYSNGTVIMTNGVGSKVAKRDTIADTPASKHHHTSLFGSEAIQGSPASPLEARNGGFSSPPLPPTREEQEVDKDTLELDDFDPRGSAGRYPSSDGREDTERSIRSPGKDKQLLQASQDSRYGTANEVLGDIMGNRASIMIKTEDEERIIEAEVDQASAVQATESLASMQQPTSAPNPIPEEAAAQGDPSYISNPVVAKQTSALGSALDELADSTEGSENDLLDNTTRNAHSRKRELASTEQEAEMLSTDEPVSKKSESRERGVPTKTDPKQSVKGNTTQMIKKHGTAKRGRPSKVSTSNPSNHDSMPPPVTPSKLNEGTSPSPATKEKRGSGRPRKSLSASVDPSPLPSATSSAKRGRGRPPRDEAGKRKSTASVEPQQPSTPRQSPRGQNNGPLSTIKLGIEAPRVLFSNASIKDRSAFLNNFKKLGGQISESHAASKFDVCVVGKDNMKKTPKLLIAIARGKPVVTEDWVVQSVNAKKLLPLGNFLPAKQIQWGYNLENMGWRGGLLSGKTVHITPALKRSWGTGYQDIECLAKAMGAANVTAKTTRALEGQEDDVVVLGLEKDDGDCATFIERGGKCFNRDLLPFGVLRGRLDLDSDEFLVTPSTSQASQKKRRGDAETQGQPAPKRGRPRKSG